MGREIRRVPLDFDWPLNQRWKGFVSPNDGTAECLDCRIDGRSTGYSTMGNAIYAMAHHSCRTPILPSELTQLLPEELKFMEALHRSAAPTSRRIRRIEKEHGMRPYIMGRTITDPSMMCYDIMRHLSKTLHVSMKKTFLCAFCKGETRVVVDPVQNAVSRKWRRKNPPKGPGWQVWETVSEGSPITPVFATAEELVEHLVTVGTTGDAPTTRERAAAFVGVGFAMSAVIVDGVMHTGINSASASVAS